MQPRRPGPQTTGVSAKRPLNARGRSGNQRRELYPLNGLSFDPLARHHHHHRWREGHHVPAESHFQSHRHSSFDGSDSEDGEVDQGIQKKREHVHDLNLRMMQRVRKNVDGIKAALEKRFEMENNPGSDVFSRDVNMQRLRSRLRVNVWRNINIAKTRRDIKDEVKRGMETLQRVHDIAEAEAIAKGSEKANAESDVQGMTPKRSSVGGAAKLRRVYRERLWKALVDPDETEIIAANRCPKLVFKPPDIRAWMNERRILREKKAASRNPRTSSAKLRRRKTRAVGTVSSPLATIDEDEDGEPDGTAETAATERKLGKKESREKEIAPNPEFWEELEEFEEYRDPRKLPMFVKYGPQPVINGGSPIVGLHIGGMVTGRIELMDILHQHVPFSSMINPAEIDDTEWHAPSSASIGKESFGVQHIKEEIAKSHKVAKEYETMLLHSKLDPFLAIHPFQNATFEHHAHDFQHHLHGRRLALANHLHKSIQGLSSSFCPGTLSTTLRAVEAEIDKVWRASHPNP
eukprot:g4519.t1